MGLKDQVLEQKRQLESGKKPYETAAAVVLFALLLYQWATIANMYLLKWANNATFFQTGTTNLPIFVTRFYNQSTIGNIIAPLVYVLYLLLVFVFVWWYCNKRGHAKWTWTLIVLFSPNIFLVSPYVIYGAFVFRVYLYRFVKSVILDFKHYDYTKDVEEVEEENQMIREQQEKRQAEKELKKAEKKEQKEDVDEQVEDKKNEE